MESRLMTGARSAIVPVVCVAMLWLPLKAGAETVGWKELWLPKDETVKIDTLFETGWQRSVDSFWLAQGAFVPILENGKITKFRIMAAAVNKPSLMRFNVLRSMGKPGEFSVVGRTGMLQLEANKVNEIAADIDVQAGDQMSATLYQGFDAVIASPGLGGDMAFSVMKDPSIDESIFFDLNNINSPNNFSQTNAHNVRVAVNAEFEAAPSPPTPPPPSCPAPELTAGLAHKQKAVIRKALTGGGLKGIKVKSSLVGTKFTINAQAKAGKKSAKLSAVATVKRAGVFSSVTLKPKAGQRKLLGQLRKKKAFKVAITASYQASVGGQSLMGQLRSSLPATKNAPKKPAKRSGAKVLSKWKKKSASYKRLRTRQAKVVGRAACE